jgi:hypothetical protein
MPPSWTFHSQRTASWWSRFWGTVPLAGTAEGRSLKVAICLIILVLPTPFGPPQGGVPAQADIL